jgi:SAM-dependent MidA family methyltransferase
VAVFSTMDSPLVKHLRSRIQHDGPLSFRDFMEEALYHPEFGYYTSSRNPLGREGDFYTSSDLDPVFGKLLAAKFREMAESLGVSEESFTILELGAGRGLLARQILGHGRFPYCILERSEAMRERQRETLSGLAVEWLDGMPSGLTGCVFSNEFFDALPVHRVVRRNGELREIYVTADFRETEGDLQEPLDVPIAEGQLADICVDARRWVQRIAASLRRGYHVAIDYGYQEREFYARPRGTLMCYWRHQAIEDPYVRVGEQDITAHVNFTDLMTAGEAAGLENVSLATQMDFLIQQGIFHEIEKLVPATNADAVQRMMAIKKLILPDAMGHRFKVLIQRQFSV